MMPAMLAATAAKSVPQSIFTILVSSWAISVRTLAISVLTSAMSTLVARCAWLVVNECFLLRVSSYAMIALGCFTTLRMTRSSLLAKPVSP